MARYDVHANPVAAERRRIPYLLDVQNDYIDSLLTRVVVPLHHAAAFGRPARHLNPLLEVNGQPVVLDAAALGAIPAGELKQPVASLRESRALIQEALDTLFGAY